MRGERRGESGSKHTERERGGDGELHGKEAWAGVPRGQDGEEGCNHKKPEGAQGHKVVCMVRSPHHLKLREGEGEGRRTERGRRGARTQDGARGLHGKKA